ncbi:MAG: META domain-containing protein [Pseudomonadota bacterium]
MTHRMRRSGWTVRGACLALALASVLAAPGARADFLPLDGILRIPDGFRFPPGSRLIVELVDISGAEAVVLASVAVKPGRDDLLDFQLSYDTEMITRKSGYRLRARAVDDGHVLLRSVRSVPVLGEVPAYSVEIVLETLRLTEGGGGPVGPDWRAVEIDDEAALTVTSATLILGEDGRASGSTGCNRFQGGFQVTGDSLTFGRFAVTRRGCTTAIAGQEKRYLRALSDVSGFRRSGDRLILTDAAGAEILRFERTR